MTDPWVRWDGSGGGRLVGVVPGQQIEDLAGAWVVGGGERVDECALVVGGEVAEEHLDDVGGLIAGFTVALTQPVIAG